MKINILSMIFLIVFFISCNKFDIYNGTQKCVKEKIINSNKMYKNGKMCLYIDTVRSYSYKKAIVYFLNFNGNCTFSSEFYSKQVIDKDCNPLFNSGDTLDWKDFLLNRKDEQLIYEYEKGE